MISTAQHWEGKVPYCWDGGTPSGPSHGSGQATQKAEGATNCLSGSTVGFDCTGLILYAVAQATGNRIVLPHDSSQASVAVSKFGGTKITNSNALQPGDLVYFGGSFGNFEHAGIYLGGGNIVDANVAYAVRGIGTRPDGVHEEPLRWQYTFVGGVRLPDVTPTLPGQPTNPSVQSTTSSSAVLTWGDASNNEDRFVTQYKIGNGGWNAGPSVGANIKSATISGLHSSTTYTFQVGAQNGAGTKWSAFAYGTTTASPTLPAEPTNFDAITVGPSTVSLNWTDASNNEDRFVTQYRTDGGGWTPGPSTGANTHNVVVEGLSAATHYTFQVGAQNSVGTRWSEYAATTTAAAPAPTLPAEPTNVSVSSTTSSSAYLTWADASNNEDRFVSQYKVGNGPWISGPSAGAGSTSTTIGGLAASTAYTFQIGAQNSAGTHWSAYAYGTTAATSTVTLPAEPANVSVTSTTSGSASLSWTDTSTNETSFASQYKIGSGSWVAGSSVGAGATSMTITGLAASTAYTFQIGARNAAGTHWSAYAYGTTTAAQSVQPQGSETAGGVTHTWTNYTNAGGTQGPSINPGQSVAVSCRLTGFQVADGNTWWYRIAASPWSNNYYASADAFYNNGATSGSLSGTPFVDTSVPVCASSAPPPPPPPPAAPQTWSETTGGVAHTWTNYTNAGGTQGPSINSNQTVQIACRLTGFQVADGNTWWYRIASSPWNSAYYVSADAFYNNGATSGSLHGTPFVDTAVATC